MGEHSKIARRLFSEGYNCAQAVFCAFSEELGMDVKTAAKIASSFGGGMAGTRSTCGAVSGMMLVLGALRGYAGGSEIGKRGEQFAVGQDMICEFEKENGSTICRELLSRGKKHTCCELVELAAGIAEKYLKI